MVGVGHSALVTRRTGGRGGGVPRPLCLEFGMPVLNVHIEHNVGTQMAFNGIKGYSKQKDIPDRINGTEEEDILRVALLTGLGLWMPFPEDPLEMLLWLVSDWLTPLGN